ncbi:MAG: hypothetical protein ABJF23_06095 [Bryobacteraceae bacterium]
MVTTPRAGLLALSDPYDPAQNGTLRIHDLSLYKGHYYAYFGPAPAISLLAPYQIATGKPLPSSIAAALFAMGAFFAGCWVLRLLLNRWFPAAPAVLYYGLAVTMGFCNTFPFLLRRPAVYEVSIASGQFFLLTGIALVIKASFEHRSVVWNVASGCFLGAAVLSKASLMLAAGFLFLPLLLNSGRQPGKNWQRFFAGALPMAAAVGLFLFYNWVRFDSPFEFGTRYQLAAVHSMKTILFSAARIPLQSSLFLAYPPQLKAAFPFLFASKPAWEPGSKYLLFETVTGLLWLSPLLLFLPALLLRRRLFRSEHVAILSLLVGTGLLLLLLDASVMATMRYEAEFATLFFLAAAVAVAGIGEQLSLKRHRIAFGIIVASLSLFGILINSAIGLAGYYNGLNVSAPEQFETLRSLFAPVASALAALGFAR